MNWQTILMLVGDLFVCVSFILCAGAVAYLSLIIRKSQKSLDSVAESLPMLVKQAGEIAGFEKGLPNVAASMVQSTEILRMSVDRLSQYFIGDATRRAPGSTFQPSDENVTREAQAAASQNALEGDLARAQGNFVGSV